MASNNSSVTTAAPDPYAGVWNGRSDAALSVIGIILFLICVWTVFGNILVILSPLTNRKLRNVSNYFITSLAIADTLLGITVLPFSAIYELRRVWDLGVVFCNIYVASDVFLCTASMLSLFAISVDRYLAISDPFSYHERMTRTKAMIFILVLWLISLLISFIPVHVGWNTSNGEVQNYDNKYQCGLATNLVFSLIDGILLFFLPLIVMCVIYIRVLLIAREQARKINALNVNLNRGEGSKNRSAVDEHKATKVLAVVMGCFVICWVPYFMQFTFSELAGWKLSHDAYSVLLWLGYINSSINPVLYALLNTEYRKAFKRLVCCCCSDDSERKRWEYSSDTGELVRKKTLKTVSGDISMAENRKAET
ncbi:histamine H2 receptor-like [Ptychodera flava]|uniref:histamine H2 receptor-like n=1 Tax=Ptychodera flava TaxID=63121 RepID=UPI00396A6243